MDIGKEIMEVMNNKIVKYDNSFNKTSLSVLTEIQSDILMAVLEKMGKEVEFDSEGNRCYIARYKFRDIRNLIDSKSLQAKRIKAVFDSLLKTQVEIFEDGIYTKANLFSSYSLTDTSTAEIVLSSALTKKLITEGKRYTVLQLDEYVKLKNKYSKELYRLLRQFRHTGFLVIKKEDLMKSLSPPKSYNENHFIKRILIPAVEDVSQFFIGLNISNYEIGENFLPDVCQFKFQKHKRNKVIERARDNDDMEELLEYIMKNGGS